jgi:hypothetical protein
MHVLWFNAKAQFRNSGGSARNSDRDRFFFDALALQPRISAEQTRFDG